MSKLYSSSGLASINIQNSTIMMPRPMRIFGDNHQTPLCPYIITILRRASRDGSANTSACTSNQSCFCYAIVLKLPALFARTGGFKSCQNILLVILINQRKQTFAHILVSIRAKRLHTCRYAAELNFNQLICEFLPIGGQI